MRTINALRVIGRIAATGSVIAALTGCAAQFQNHGYIPPQEQLDQITVGQDTRETVRAAVGVPSSSGLVNESGMYFVRSRKKSLALFAPQEIDRQVVAISFNGAGVVQNVERFGLERGRVVPLSRRVTSSSVGNKTFLRQLLGNIGRFNPAGLTN